MRRPSARSTSQSSGQLSRETSRRPSRSQRLPPRPSVVEVFGVPTPPQSVHVRSDPTYVGSPATASFCPEDLQGATPAQREPLHDLTRFESYTSTFASTATSFSNASSTSFEPEDVPPAMPEMVHRPTQGTMRSTTSTWKPPAVLAQILRDFWRKEQRGEVAAIEEPYKVVHKLANEVVSELPPVNVSLPFLDEHPGVGPIARLDFVNPVTSERVKLWQVDAETGFADMHVVTLKPERLIKSERPRWGDALRGCLPTIDAIKACFRVHEH